MNYRLINKFVGVFCVLIGVASYAFSESKRLVQKIKVPGDAPWVDSGIYLEKGESIEVIASGEWGWTQSPQAAVPASGQAEMEGLFNGCPYFSLVGRIGLSFEQHNIICVGKRTVFKAETSGVLYFAMNDGGFSDNWGYLDVQILHNSKEHKTYLAKDISLLDIENHPYDKIEVSSEFVSLTLPTEYVKKRFHSIKAGMAYYDLIVNEYRKFTHNDPYTGYKTRFYSDYEAAKKYGFGMVAGNPIFYHEGLIQEGLKDTGYLMDFVSLDLETTSLWGVLHELGHNFTIQNNVNMYFVGAGMAESWANVLTQYFLEKHDRPEKTRKDAKCNGLEFPLDAEANYNLIKTDSWRGFCMLMEVKDVVGWEAFGKFFQSISDLNADEKKQLAAKLADEPLKWQWILDSLVKYSGKPGIKSIFEKFGLPVK